MPSLICSVKDLSVFSDDIELVSLEVKGKEKAVEKQSDIGLNGEKEALPSGQSSQQSTNTLVSDVNVEMTKAGVGDAEEVKVDYDDIESLSEAESEVFDDIFLKTINRDKGNEVISDDDISPSRSGSISPTFDFDSTLLRNLDDHLRKGVENVVSDAAIEANKRDSDKTKKTDVAAKSQEEDHKYPLVNETACAVPSGCDSEVIDDSSTKEIENVSFTTKISKNTVSQLSVASGHEGGKNGSGNPVSVAKISQSVNDSKEDNEDDKTTSSDGKSTQKTEAKGLQQRPSHLSVQECADTCGEPSVITPTETVLDHHAARGGSIQTVNDEIIEKSLDDWPSTFTESSCEESENMVSDEILDTAKTHPANVEDIKTSFNETGLSEKKSDKLEENARIIGRTVGETLSNDEKSPSKSSQRPGNVDFLPGTSQSCPTVDKFANETPLSERTSFHKTAETLLKTLDIRLQNKKAEAIPTAEISAENGMNVEDVITLIRDNCKEFVKHSVTLVQSEEIKNGTELEETGNGQETVLGNYKENDEPQQMIAKENSSSFEGSKSFVGEESSNSSAENNNSTFVPLCESLLQNVNEELRKNEVAERNENKNSKMGIGDNSSQSGNMDDCCNNDICDSRIKVIDVVGISSHAAKTEGQESSVYDTLHAELLTSKMDRSPAPTQPTNIGENIKDSETLEISTCNTEVFNTITQGEKAVLIKKTSVSSSEAMAQAEDSETNEIVSAGVSNNLSSEIQNERAEIFANHDSEMHDINDKPDLMSKARTLDGKGRAEETSEWSVANVGETIAFEIASQLSKVSLDVKVNDSNGKDIECQPLCNVTNIATINDITMVEPNDATGCGQDIELTKVSRKQVAESTHVKVTQGGKKQITLDDCLTDLCTSKDPVVDVANGLGIPERDYNKSQEIDGKPICAILAENAPKQQGGGDEKLSSEDTKLRVNRDTSDRAKSSGTEVAKIPENTETFASQNEIESSSEDYKAADVEMTISQREELLKPECGDRESLESVKPEIVAPNMHVSVDEMPLSSQESDNLANMDESKTCVVNNQDNTIVPGELPHKVSQADTVKTKKVDSEDEKYSETVSCPTKVVETKDDLTSNTDNSSDSGVTSNETAAVEKLQETSSVGDLEKSERQNHNDNVVEDHPSVQNINTSGENLTVTKKIELNEINDVNSSEITEATAVISKLLESKENCSVKHLLIDLLTKNLEDTKKDEKNETKYTFQDRSSGQSPSHDSVVTDSEYLSTEDIYVQNLLTKAGQLSDYDMDVSSYESSDIELGASTGSSETQEDKFSQSMKLIKDHDMREDGKTGEPEKSSQKNSSSEGDVSLICQRMQQNNTVEDDPVLGGFGHLNNNSTCDEWSNIKVGERASSSEALEGDLPQSDELTENGHPKMARESDHVPSVLPGAHKDTKINPFAGGGVLINEAESQTSVCKKISTQGSTPVLISRLSSWARKDVSRNSEDALKSTNEIYTNNADVSNTDKGVFKNSKGLNLHHTNLSMNNTKVSKIYQEFSSDGKAFSGNATRMSPMNSVQIPKNDTDSSTCFKEDVPTKRKDISSDTKSDIVEPRRKRGRPRRTFPANTPKRQSTRQRNPTRSKGDFGLMYSSNLSSQEIPYYRNTKNFNIDTNLSGKDSGLINEFVRPEKGREEKEPLKYSIKQVIDLIDVEDDFHLELESEEEISRGGCCGTVSATNVLVDVSTTQTSTTPNTNNLLDVSTKKASTTSSSDTLLGVSITQANGIPPSNPSFGSSSPVLISYPLANCVTPGTTIVVGSSSPTEINNSLVNSAITCKNVGFSSAFTPKNARGSLPKVNCTVTSAIPLQRETHRDKTRAEISLESSSANSLEVTNNSSEAHLGNSLLPSTIPRRRRGRRPAILGKRGPESGSIPLQVCSRVTSISKNVNKNINSYLSREISSARTRPLVELLRSSQNTSRRGSCTSGEQRPDSAMIHAHPIPKANSADRTLPDENPLPSRTLADFCCSFNSPVSPLSEEVDVLSSQSSTSSESGEKGYSSTSTALMDSQNSGSSTDSLKITLIGERDPNTGTTNWKTSSVVSGTESGKVNYYKNYDFRLSRAQKVFAEYYLLWFAALETKKLLFIAEYYVFMHLKTQTITAFLHIPMFFVEISIRLSVNT